MLRLLVVDDDIAYTRLVAYALEDVAAVASAYTLSEALALSALDVEVVLCDLNLPDAQDDAVVAPIVAAFPGTTIIATSGVDAGHGNSALQAGAHQFILKGGELDGPLRQAVIAGAERTRTLRAAASPDAVVEQPGAAGAQAVHAPVALFGTDAEGRCTWANGRFETLAGLDAAALAGAGWHDVLHPADRRDVLEAWHRDSAAATEFALDARIARPDRAISDVHLTAAPVRDDRGVLTGWVVAVSDETARRARGRQEADRRAQLESVIGASPNPIFLKDPQDRVVLANGATERMLERTHEQLIGESASSFIADDEQRERVRDLDHGVLQSGEPRTDEISARDVSGRTRTWLTTRFPVADADGILTGVGVIASDITDRRRLEREIERQRELLEEAQEVARLGTWEWDVAARRFTASRQLPRVLGLDAQDGDELLRLLVRRIHPDDRQVTVEAVRRSERQGIPQDVTFRAADRDGRLRTLRARWAPQVRDGREVLVGSTQDITQERLREAARRAAEAQLRLVFDHAPIGLGLTDLAGHWLRVNPAACSLLGRRPAELLGASIDEVVHPEDQANDAESLARLLAGELDSYEIEKRCLRPDGSRLWVVFAVSAVRGTDGRPAQLVLQLLDMTVRRDLEARLTELADVDAVTGLPNDRRLRAELERAITWRRRSGEQATLLLVELSGLATFTAEVGRTETERTLRALGGDLRRTVRRTDIVVRAEDDRFALLLPDTTRAASEIVMRKLREVVAAHELPGPPLFGVVELTSGATTPDDVLRSAHEALGEARETSGMPPF